MLRRRSEANARGRLPRASQSYAELGDLTQPALNPMTEQTSAAEQCAAVVESSVLDATSLLAASIKREGTIVGADTELVGLLESTILRVDAPDDACERAAAAIVTLASSRAASRMALP